MCATAFCRQVAKVQSAAIRSGLIYLVVGERRTAIYTDDGVHVDEVVMNTLNAISFSVWPRSRRSCGFLIIQGILLRNVPTTIRDAYLILGGSNRFCEVRRS